MPNAQRNPQQNDVAVNIPMGPPPAATNEPSQAEAIAAIMAELQAIKAGQQSAPPAQVAELMNEAAFNQELNSFVAKAHLRSARQRAERPEPIMSIATEEDQMSIHINAWKVMKYVGVAVVVAVAGYGLFLLVREGVKWVATRMHAPAAA